jgi:spore germination protein YaaH
VNSYTYSQVKNILSSRKGNAFTYESEQVFEYLESSKFKTLVYINPQGVKDRVNLAQDYKLGGVVFWRIGGEADLLSNLYNED